MSYGYPMPYVAGKWYLRDANKSFIPGGLLSYSCWGWETDCKAFKNVSDCSAYYLTTLTPVYFTHTGEPTFTPSYALS